MRLVQATAKFYSPKLHVVVLCFAFVCKDSEKGCKDSEKG